MNFSFGRVGLSLAALSLAFSGTARAVGPVESLRAAANDVAVETQGPGAFGLGRFSPGSMKEPGLAGTAIDALGGTDPAQKLDINTNSPGFQGAKAPAGAQVLKEIDLASLLNRQLKTSLKRTYGGKDIWLSGAFDRDQSAFASIQEDGKPVRFISVLGLMGNPQKIDVGTTKVTLSLAPNFAHLMQSGVILTDASGATDRINLGDLLNAVNAVGEAVSLGGQTYHAFYYDDIKNGAADPSRKLFAFIMVDSSGDFNIYIIPPEKVPSDKIAIFKMYQDYRIGLQQVNGKLRVFDNP